MSGVSKVLIGLNGILIVNKIAHLIHFFINKLNTGIFFLVKQKGQYLKSKLSVFF